MLEKIILVALFINFLLMVPAYQNLVVIWKLPKKPFQCEFCLTFWISLIISIVSWNTDYLIVAVTAPVATAMLKRAFDALPISF